MLIIHIGILLKINPKKTLEDGNCLYNAFAQELKKIVTKEQQKFNHFFKDYHSDAIQYQQKLLDVVQKRPTEEEWLENLDFHLNRESLLSRKEKQALRNSYQVALRLAEENQVKEAGDEYLILM